MAKHSIGVARAAQPLRTTAATAQCKLRVSDRLEEDAQAMEERLIQLRIKMIEDKKKLEKELPAKFGGSRWRSAQEGIGSVSRYAKDVEDRINKPPSSTSGKRIKAKKNDANENTDLSSDFKVKSKKKKKETKYDSPLQVVSLVAIKKWTTGQVLEWLTSLGLDQFQSAFEYHQVTGAVLLEMQLDELAQIGVAKLSARNRIWNELDRVKQAALATHHHRPGACMEASEIVDPKIRDMPAAPEIHSPGKGDGDAGVHWSHVKPLREQSVAEDGTQGVPVNLADGEFNEDTSHASFMKALLDWRAGDGDVEAKEDNDDGGGDLWFNPTMSANNNEDNLMSEQQGGGALFEGDYDEAKEQEEFRRAVMAWRQGGIHTEAEASRPSTTETETECTEQGCSTDKRTSCWQCYRLVRTDTLIVDDATQKAFCGSKCRSTFVHEYARLYATKDARPA